MENSELVEDGVAEEAQDFIRSIDVKFRESTLALGFALAAKQGIGFDNLLDKLLTNASALANVPEPVELDDDEVEATARKMFDVALQVEGQKTILVPWLYRQATALRWIDLSTNTRKSLGRRFKKVAKEYEDDKMIGEQIVKFMGKNSANAAEYKTKPKEAASEEAASEEAA